MKVRPGRPGRLAGGIGRGKLLGHDAGLKQVFRWHPSVATRRVSFLGKIGNQTSKRVATLQITRHRNGI